VKDGASSVRRAEAGCPSWSWAGIDGAVDLLSGADGEMVERGWERKVDVRHVEYHADPLAPFAVPNVAYIELTGQMAPVRIQERKLMCFPAQGDDLPECRISGFILHPDVTDWSEIGEKATCELLQIYKYGAAVFVTEEDNCGELSKGWIRSLDWSGSLPRG
jgi:hypothetical protein